MRAEQSRAEQSRAEQSRAEQRNECFDFIKGVLIFLVIWGHMLQKTNQSVVYESIWDNPIYKTIYTFHMPLFMILSGYLTFSSLQKRSGREFVKHRVMPLFQTVVAWGTIHLMVLLCLGKIHGLSEVVNSYTAGFWFIWAIIHCSILIVLVDKAHHTRYWYVMMILSLGLSVVSLVPSKTAFMYPFFLIGYLINDLKLQIQKYTYVGCGILYIVTLKYMISQAGSMDFNLRFRDEPFYQIVSINFLRWWVGILGCITIFAFLKWSFKYVGHTKLAGFISLLGRKTLSIYVMNVVLLEDLYGMCFYPIIVRKMGYNILYLNAELFNLVIAPIMSLAFIIIVLYVDKVLSKTYSIRRIMYGK